MGAKVSKINCKDIYREETEHCIRILKRFREAWMKSNHVWSNELLKFADDDFYFYRFAIDRQEKASNDLLLNILLRVMDRYGIQVEALGNAPFDFVICENNIKTGYSLKDFHGEDVNYIVDKYKLDQAIIIRTTKSIQSDKWIERLNKRYQNEKIKLKELTIHDFFRDRFGNEELNEFCTAIDSYLQEVRNIIGYQSIKVLSSMNLASQRLFEEKMLAEWDYINYKYQIINPSNPTLNNYLYILHEDTVLDNLDYMRKVYIDNKLYKALLGAKEYAESFITSEWLYYSLKGRKNFDYTSIISGYLKSIEQLLYQIVMLNIDNNCKISMKANMLDTAYAEGVKVYESKKYKWVNLSFKEESEGYKYTKFPYIDFITTQVSYMDSSIGTFEYFLRNNPHIFYDKTHAKTIADMISCFRTEFRNGFFHTHNLYDWQMVEIIRNNAIYLYFVLLGSTVMAKEKENELGIQTDDDFDELCKKIRAFRHYSLYFIFEYADGKQQKMIYDFINNTIEFTNDGVEHYDRLVFYLVDKFEGAFEQLDKGIREEQIFYLTRNNLPNRIFGVHTKFRNNEIEEIQF